MILDISLINIPSISTKISTYNILDILTNSDLDVALIAKWVIIASWINPEVGLPRNLDSGTMMIDLTSTDYDLTQIIIYNYRDSDLHALVQRHPRMKIPESI